MNEDHLSPGETIPPNPLTPVQKQWLAVLGVLFLMAGSFFAGRYTAPAPTPTPNPIVQIPTPMPMGTPVPVPESALTMIDFTGVSASKKAEVLAYFNSHYCQCGCKMTVAECMIRDPNCPFWNDHVTQFQKALGNGRKPKLSMVRRPVMMAPGASNGFTLPNGATQGLVLPPGGSNGFNPPPSTAK